MNQERGSQIESAIRTDETGTAESPFEGEERRLASTVLVVGPLPPPMMGPAIGTQIMRRAFERAGARVLLVNTQDRRSVVSNVGVFDLRNVALALLHAGQTFWRARRASVDFAYIPISQGRWGYARDALLIGIARSLDKPVVVHLRGAKLQAFYRSSSRFERAVIRKTLGSAEVAIALTPALRGVYEGLVAPERVRVLENAIPDPWPEGISDVVSKRRKRAEEDPRTVDLLYVANDFATKGFRTAIGALAWPGLEHARLTMVGAPQDEVAAEAWRLAEELGVKDRLELTGELLDRAKFELFEAADIFAYPTENDGQPLVVLEAMAAGLPIVTTTQGGVPDSVGDAALLAEPGDLEAFAAGIKRLVDEPDFRLALGAQARERFLAHYTPDRFQRRFVETFADVGVPRGLDERSNGKDPAGVGRARLTEDAAQFWSESQPGFKFTSAEVGTPKFFADVEAHRYSLEPHIPEIVDFPRWAGKDVLDAGCGIATDGLQFARAGARYTGLDLTETALELARTRFALENREGRFVRGSVTDLPFDDQSFDLVFSHGVIHHVPDTEAAVEEFRRVLRPGGTAIVMLYHRNSLNYFVNVMFFRRALVGLLKVPGGAEVLPKLTGENQDVLRGHQKLLDQYGMQYLADSELFLSKNTDGPLNPLSKVYSREEARQLFGNFSEVTTAVRFLNLRLYPAGDKLASTTAARKLERNFGWHLYLRAVR